MKGIWTFLRDLRGASAAEFALVLPLFLLFLLGIIDAGRYAWAFNQAEKATQIGARWAVATQVIPGGDAANGLLNYNFINAGSVSGDPVTETAFGPGVICSTTATDPVCTCKTANKCPFGVAATSDVSKAAWTALVNRMREIYPEITGRNVVVEYNWSGLGYAGDPNGPDVSPLITVSLRCAATASDPGCAGTSLPGMKFQPITTMLFDVALRLPTAGYTLTMEDGRGGTSN